MVPGWVGSVRLSQEMRWEVDLPAPSDRPKLHAAPEGVAFSQSSANTEDAVPGSPEVRSW